MTLEQSPIGGYVRLSESYLPPFKMSDAPNPYGLNFQSLLNLLATNAWVLVRENASTDHNTGDILLVVRLADEQVQVLRLDQILPLLRGLSLSKPSPTLEAEDLNPEDGPRLEGCVVIRPRF